MAYAAVVSLMKTIDHCLHTDVPSTILERDQIESLHKEASLLQDLLNDFQGIITGAGEDDEMKNLERKITRACYEAEDFLDSHIYNACLPEGSPEIEITKRLPQIERLMRSIKTQLMKIHAENCNSNSTDTNNSLTKKGKKKRKKGRTNSLQEGSLRAPPGDDTTVGLDENVVALVDQLTGPPSYLKVISVVGMGGIGKTTLAKRLYDDPYVVHYFYIRAWVTVSQKYQLREMLLGILGCVIGHLSEEHYRMREEQLEEHLYKKLKGRKYLIMLDDVWDTKAWDGIKRCFPDDHNGSRVMFTTRLKEVADYASPSSPHHFLRLLNTSQCWQLLHSKVFMRESCPAELEGIGKQIAAKCHGLPLIVAVVAGFLSTMRKKQRMWEKVAQSLGSYVNTDPENCLNILALSYNHLPHHLKPCFLYVGAFAEDAEIPAWKLKLLWLAEGFVLPNRRSKSLEQVAEERLQDLIDRSLVMIVRRSSNGRVKTCMIHDNLREMCLREAEKANFLHVTKPYAQVVQRILDDQRRLSFHHYSDVRRMPSTLYIRSLLFLGLGQSSVCLTNFPVMNFKLLRVLDLMYLKIDPFPIEVGQLVHLRYLALSLRLNVGPELPSTISKLWNLQTFIVKRGWLFTTLPQEIWHMENLRHLHFKEGCHLSIPKLYGNIYMVLPNLQTLSMVMPSSCTKEVLSSVPNLKKLGIWANHTDLELVSRCLTSLICLCELETLKCYISGQLPRQRHFQLPSWDAFPKTLKKLTLINSSLPWEDMSILGMLPNLEILKAKSYAFFGKEWEPVPGGFLQLRFLLIDQVDLEDWKATDIHFPRLEHLVLKRCDSLNELPDEIGEIPTLLMIELHFCSESAERSAKEIQIQQQSMGNEGLKLRILRLSSKSM